MPFMSKLHQSLHPKHKNGICPGEDEHIAKNIPVSLCLWQKVRETLKPKSTLGIINSNFAIFLFGDPNYNA